MAKDKLDTWLGVIGNLAVVIGLVVVAAELRQNAAVANGELTSQFMANWQEFERSRQDPEFAAVYAKSIESPAQLALAEKVQLDGYYWIVMDQLELARMLVDLELFEGPYEKILRDNVRLVFTTPYAHAWWQSNGTQFDPATATIISDELSRTDPNKAQTLYQAIETTLPK